MWTYQQPTRIVFGIGSRKNLYEIVTGFGRKPILVTDAGFKELPATAETLAVLGSDVRLFCEVTPNPTVDAVDALARTIRDSGCDVVAALGGGSPLDCAKAACSVAVQEGSARDYHSGGAKLDGRHLPLIAVPTTAGTGSEVTPISVLDDPGKGIKAPVVHDNFYPTVALIDPELTLTMPRYVTACTGLDALAHAVEGYWSCNHQPICDAMALEAVSLVMTHLSLVLDDGEDLSSREAMSLAATLGGLAFQIPKNAAVHACSFPLSSRYHLAHGAACAMTLDHFIRYNAEAMGDRAKALAKAAQATDMEEFADKVAALKVQGGVPNRLSEVGVGTEDLDSLVKDSFHPLMKNNPREVTAADLRSIYGAMM